MKRATIENPEPKTFRVMLGDHEIGVSKTDFDARFHVNAINDALDVAFLEGEKYLERMVEKLRMELELQEAQMQAQAEITEHRIQFEESQKRPRGLYTGGGMCKKCGGSTTYKRAETHGLCMQCETENGGGDL